MATPTMPVGGVQPHDGATTPADLVVRNGKIYTGDRDNPTATAAAIKDGVFVAVGDDATVASHIGHRTRIIDALGKRIIPGLNDSHTHVIRGGNNYLLELRWDGVRSLKHALQMLREQAARTPEGQWVRVVGGWTAEQFAEKRLPTLKELNDAAPNTPVFVLHLYQSALLNKAALRAVGYTKDTPNPLGGQIVRDHSGEPTGLLLAAPGAALLYSTLGKGPHLSEEQKEESTKHFFRELNRFGLTSAIDAAGGFQDFPDDYGTITALADRGELSVRVAYHLFPQTAGQEIDDLKRWIGMVSPGDGDEWLRANGAGENLAWSPADFENFAEPRPQLTNRAAGELEEAARLLLEHGWGFRLHATYDETIRHNLDVFEKIARDLGQDTLGVPWLFDHAETISDQSIDRVKALGGNVAIQNRMYFQGKVFKDRYGNLATEWAPPVTKLLDAGLVVGAGTDATRVSSYNPWLSLHWLTTGTDIGGNRLYSPENIVDRETALEMYTVSGAKLTGEADKKGTISVGKYGDLAILTEDYFAVSDDRIPFIEAAVTVAGGKVVYANDEYDGQAVPLPEISVDWSPVKAYGGYHSEPTGVRQARAFLDAAADSKEQSTWRASRGETVSDYGALGDDFC
ncbi:amidohydrolase [Nocardioides sp. DS6]|uniref:Amidohydrolase n=1 Tax=Nocardioides eburneus TaxID=3231482 RepID=A0ABV3T010_9ACTN